MSLLTKIFGDTNARYLRDLQPTIERIDALASEYSQLSAEQIKSKTSDFRKRLSTGETLDDLLPEAFALVREAASRTIKQSHFSVQLIGGMVLHQGKIAEMRTGEGKTLTSTLATYLNALADSSSNGGVHVVTVNDYLSRRDAVWMGQIYNALGLSVGVLNHDSSFLYDESLMSNDQGETSVLDQGRDLLGAFKVVHEFLRPVTRREAYQADITYGTNNEFGFDYLRDNLVGSLEQKVQARGHHFAIVDEVDSILIDEARTPLIISMPDAESTKLYSTFAKIVPSLQANTDYNIDEKLKAATLTEEGIEQVEKAMGLTNIYEEGGTRYVHHLEQALKASVLFKRDRDYVVKNDEVIIVDEFTGRLMPGRRWSDGLHQAVEAKEGVSVQKESRTLATITFQNYFRLYKKLAGMTGTAATSAEELFKVYNLEVVVVPPNKVPQRVDLPDNIYKTEVGKFKSVVEEIKTRHIAGQPVLVGTVSIEKNELLSTMLEQAGVPHRVLNAKQHEKEGEIIAQAGRAGAVTVATNMAGRGVDIILGGNPPSAAEAERVRGVGGLYVIGTERHEARRIDNQLRGRAGRQGDPGAAQFFVSTEDDVVRIFGGDRLKNVLETLGVAEDEAISSGFVSRAIEQAQSKIEGHNFDARKYVLEYDDVMNRHRTAIYEQRDNALASTDHKTLIRTHIHQTIERFVSPHLRTVGQDGEDLALKEIAENFKAMTGYSEELMPKLKESEQSGEIYNFLTELAWSIYDNREKEMGSEQMRQLEKLVLLRVIDELWMDHLENMEYLRDSVRLRAYGQRDPLVEYKIEGQKMFEQLLANIELQVAGMIFKVGLTQTAPVVNQQAVANLGGEESGPGHTVKKDTTHGEINRNDPCWCGSGKKFKKCHGA
ncbi:MAG: preprotein translocase subunit SecA [Candidatus Yanofskybacteria bacterium RIFCSPLOWO2_02_FULL_45_10]|uniref:Protein translocase subunit SecA n=2 Tax=Candidatus Yanofskyibacteriota TaxID=1752733 RepID=A0A1F8G4X2_9BACT|nr:MAG: preprotein translocase subunit SecA [Candidatus Yanofskybacteria bacterium RIFCSPHIGHO2_12_FULL_45_19b]OGN31935.1 MAG: preprotein translocase subunit SecA [Candidatus Yanofskybacteria bacterium RIFCSPLOWO2_02_FULL_45_10]